MAKSTARQKTTSTITLPDRESVVRALEKVRADEAQLERLLFVIDGKPVPRDQAAGVCAA